MLRGTLLDIDMVAEMVCFLFDMVAEMQMNESLAAVEQSTIQNTQDEATSSNQLPTLHLWHQKEAEFAKQSLTFQLRQHEESKYAEPSLTLPDLEMHSSVPFNTIAVPTVPTFYPAFVPVPLTLWPTSVAHVEEAGTTHEILKPTPLNGKEVIKADDVVGMSKLSIGEASSGSMEPTALSLQLIGSMDTRQSAFHVSSPMNRPELSKRQFMPFEEAWNRTIGIWLLLMLIFCERKTLFLR